MTGPSESSAESADKPETPAGTPETPPRHAAPGGYPPQQAAPGGYPPPPNPYPAGQYPPAGPPPTQQPYSGFTPPPVGPKNGLGIASLIIAIVGLLFVWTVAGGLILGIVAVVIGLAARGRVKRGEADNGGVAIAGIVLGLLAIVVSLIFIPIWLSVWNTVGGDDYFECISNAGGDEEKVEQCLDDFKGHLESELSITLTPSP